MLGGPVRIGTQYIFGLIYPKRIWLEQFVVHDAKLWGQLCSFIFPNGMFFRYEEVLKFWHET